jgi:hypothetical protein
MMVSEPSVVHHTSNCQVVPKKLCLSAVLIGLSRHMLGDGGSLGTPWELSGSSLGSRCSCVYKKQDSEVFFVKSRDEIHNRMSGFVIIHSMVAKDQIYQKFKGHMVLTHCWRIKTANGLCGSALQSSDLCMFVES